MDNAEVDFETLANEHKDSVYRQMLRVCGNHADAEDVVIEALLRAWKNLGQLQDAGAFRGWLAQIARRICWNLRSKEALQPVLQLSALEESGRQFGAPAQATENDLDMARMKEILLRALAGLPEDYRRVYEMRDLEEQSGEEVAGKLGITLASMKSRLHRARTMLRESLDAAVLEGRTI